MGFFSGEKQRKKLSGTPDKSRRRFLAGAASSTLSTVALGGVARVALEKEEVEPVYDDPGIDDLIVQDQASEPAHSFEGVTNSKNFISQTVKLSEVYERELPKVIEFIKQATRKDPEGRNRMDYLREMFHADGVPEVAMQELKKQIVGLAFEESRFDSDRVSSAKARGILQIIQSTWDEHAKDGEEIRSLVDQTRVAGELLSQTYRHLIHEAGEEMEAIKKEYFDDDEEQFERYFLAPVLINSYNAGMGNMDNLVRWFTYQYPKKKQTIGIFDNKKMVSGQDVFLAMIEKYTESHPNSSYKKHACEYTLKVYAAALCLLRQDPELFSPKQEA